MNYYFVTICTKYSRKPFKDNEVPPLSNKEMIYLKRISLKFFANQPYELRYISIVPDHVHLLVYIKDIFILKKVIKSYKGYTSYKVNHEFRGTEEGEGRQRTLWSQRYNISFINDKAHLVNAIRYICTNKRHHGYTYK